MVYVLLSALFVVLGITFGCLKALEVIAWSWWWALSPLWALLALPIVIVVIAIVVAVFFAATDEDEEE